VRRRTCLGIAKYIIRLIAGGVERSLSWACCLPWHHWLYYLPVTRSSLSPPVLLNDDAAFTVAAISSAGRSGFSSPASLLQLLLLTRDAQESLLVMVRLLPRKIHLFALVRLRPSAPLTYTAGIAACAFVALVPSVCRSAILVCSRRRAPGRTCFWADMALLILYKSRWGWRGAARVLNVSAHRIKHHRYLAARVERRWQQHNALKRASSAFWLTRQTDHGPYRGSWTAAKALSAACSAIRLPAALRCASTSILSAAGMASWRVWRRRHAINAAWHGVCAWRTNIRRRAFGVWRVAC